MSSNGDVSQQFEVLKNLLKVTYGRFAIVDLNLQFSEANAIFGKSLLIYSVLHAVPRIMRLHVVIGISRN